MQHFAALCITGRDLIRTPSSLACITEQVTERLPAHPFLQRCADGGIRHKELDDFPIQQGKYSQYFRRYLCALISTLNDGDDAQPASSWSTASAMRRWPPA